MHDSKLFKNKEQIRFLNVDKQNEQRPKMFVYVDVEVILSTKKFSLYELLTENV